MDAEKTDAKAAAEDGIKVVYTAYDLPFTAGDFTTYVQAMKAAGVNGIWLGDTVPADSRSITRWFRLDKAQGCINLHRL